MRYHLADVLAPHYCCSCGEVGSLLCQYCKYDITQDAFAQCIACLKPTGAAGKLCGGCKTSYMRGWCAGERHDGLKRLIDQYKFDRARAATDPLVDLLDEILPILPEDTLVVAVPTIWQHIRQRGYDHAERIARRFADTRKLRYATPLTRRSRTKQLGATRAQRIEQARQAFAVRHELAGQRCLLIDDVFTTGASVEYAAQMLLRAGASEVWVAVVAIQPIEE